MCLTVALDNNYRTDDLEHLISAIKQLKGVLDVRADVSDSTTWLALTKARFDLREKLWALLKEEGINGNIP